MADDVSSARRPLLAAITLLAAYALATYLVIDDAAYVFDERDAVATLDEKAIVGGTNPNCVVRYSFRASDGSSYSGATNVAPYACTVGLPPGAQFRIQYRATDPRTNRVPPEFDEGVGGGLIYVLGTFIATLVFFYGGRFSRRS